MYLRTMGRQYQMRRSNILDEETQIHMAIRENRIKEIASGSEKETIREAHLEILDLIVDV